MKRQIKLRAWDRRDKQFVYFELFPGVNNHTPDIYTHADLETWEQFTGLLDKNGKEIYEGDLLKDSQTGEVRKVEWISNSFQLVNAEGKWGAFISRIRLKEIVGNVFANPDLLTK